MNIFFFFSNILFTFYLCKETKKNESNKNKMFQLISMLMEIKWNWLDALHMPCALSNFSYTFLYSFTEDKLNCGRKMQNDQQTNSLWFVSFELSFGRKSLGIAHFKNCKFEKKNNSNRILKFEFHENVGQNMFCFWNVSLALFDYFSYCFW